MRPEGGGFAVEEVEAGEGGAVAVLGEVEEDGTEGCGVVGVGVVIVMALLIPVWALRFRKQDDVIPVLFNLAAAIEVAHAGSASGAFLAFAVKLGQPDHGVCWA